MGVSKTFDAGSIPARRAFGCWGWLPCRGRRPIAGSGSIRVGRGRVGGCWSVMGFVASGGRLMMMGVVVSVWRRLVRLTMCVVPWMVWMMIRCRI